jgi:cyclic peptide transporter
MDHFAGELRWKIASALPSLALLALVSGIANVFVVFAVTAVLAGGNLEAHADRFLLAGVVYLVARKALEKRLIVLVSDVVYKTRATLLKQVLSQPFERFEEMERGSIYTVICEDTTTLGNTVGSFATLVTSVVTIMAAFVYLVVLHPPLALVMGVVVGLVSFGYARRCAGAKESLASARTSWNGFVGKVEEALDGFKELALHFPKRNEFRVAAERQCEQARANAEVARLSLLDAFLFGELLLLGALGMATFVSAQFAGLDLRQRAGFVIILLYLIGPVKTLLATAPLLVEAKLAWQRIKLVVSTVSAPNVSSALPPRVVQTLELSNLSFQYQNSERTGMRVGPIDVTIARGECLFLTGGNGSGKTTLAKVITGLYEPQTGEVRVDGKRLSRAELGEYFSAIFSPCFVFDQLYGVGATADRLDSAMDRLGLLGRVERKNGWIDNVRLSAGQRKRVALLEAFLQERPILLFDEVTADQDSEFRRLFYEEILGELKRAGKIVVVITHDDKYFHVADNILKLDLGREVSLHAPADTPHVVPEGKLLIA